MQISAIPVPVVYTPIQRVPPVAAVARDPTAEAGDGQRPRSAPPSGIRQIIDLLV